MHEKLEKLIAKVNNEIATRKAEIKLLEDEIKTAETKLSHARNIAKEAPEKNDIKAYRDAQLDIGFYTDVIKTKKRRLNDIVSKSEEHEALIRSFNVEQIKVFKEVGDDVFIWDNENITLEEVAKKCNTINYEILSTISERVPRLFK